MNLFLTKLKYFLMVGLTSVLVGLHPVQAEMLLANISTLNAEALSYENGRYKGLLSRGYSCVFDNVGYEINIDSVPHARILENLKAGIIDLGFPMLKTKDRDEYALFAEPLHTIRFVILENKEQKSLSVFSAKDAEYPESVSIAVKIGTYTEKYAAEIFPVNQNISVTFQRVNDWEQSVKMVKLGRVSAAIIPDVVYRGMDIDESDLNIVYTPEVFEGSIYLSKKSTNVQGVLKEINAAIFKCKEKGFFSLN